GIPTQCCSSVECHLHASQTCDSGGIVHKSWAAGMSSHKKIGHVSRFGQMAQSKSAPNCIFGTARPSEFPGQVAVDAEIRGGFGVGVLTESQREVCAVTEPRIPAELQFLAVLIGF